MSRKVLLLGDSHIIQVMSSFQKLNSPFQVFGTHLPLGKRWGTRFHTATPSLKFSNPDAQVKFNEIAKEAGLNARYVTDLNIPVVFSLSAVERLVYHWDWLAHSPFYREEKHFLSNQLFEQIIRDHFSHFFEFFEILTAHKVKCFNIIGPGPRQPDGDRGALFIKIKNLVTEIYRGYGVSIIDTTETTSYPNGALLPQFWSDMPNDQLHGNYEWGKVVAEAIQQKMIFD
ncbi:MAG: hypothetical protein AB3N28_04270 [Kordiimonas sp.]